MCGIIGYYSASRHDGSLKKGMEAMRYRGPDSSGEYSFETNGRYLGVGHVRLKVLDLDDRSAQPFLTASGDSLIVFNGEVYNFESLKELLPEHKWRTTSDTEVIAELLESYGNSIVGRFNGIFAIARVCLVSGDLTLFRDPLGVKPLYYSVIGSELFFASEIKSLSRFPIDMKVSKADLLECLNFGYVHEPHTGFEMIKKVAPGEMVHCINGDVSRSLFTYEASHHTFSEGILTDAITRQCVSDVPLGVFFSGGADSTVIASQLDGDLLYINCRLDESSKNEERYARELASTFGRDLLTATLPQEDDFEKILEVVDQIIVGAEEPITDLTYSVSADLACLARDKGFTVMLSGMGADEIFGGYLRYYIVKYRRFFDPLFRLYLALEKIRGKGSKHKLDRIRHYLDEKSFLKKYARLVGYFSSNDLRKLFGAGEGKDLEPQVFERLLNSIPESIRHKKFAAMRYLECKGFLAHNLTVADKSAMKASIELRVPFLDLELYSTWIGPEVDKPGSAILGKKPLLKLLRQKINFKWSPFSKTGFNPPISEFFKSVGRADVADIVCTDEMLSVFSYEGLVSVIDECFDSSDINYHKIWQLVFIARWLNFWKPKGLVS